MKNIFGVLFILLFFSCSEENSFETIDELVVEAFLHAGEPLDSVNFSRIIPFDALEEPDKPNDLNAVIIDEEGMEYVLDFTGVDGQYSKTDLTIETGTSYTIEVDYNGEMVRASTFIPSKPFDLVLSDTILKRVKIETFTDLQNQDRPDPIELSWEGEEGAFYFVEVENIEASPEAINTLFEDNGFERPRFRSEPSMDNFYNINSFRDLTHFGTYKVTVYRVNPEYVALYEDNTSGAGSINEIRTNVENGFGIFTGINQEVIYFEVERI